MILTPKSSKTVWIYISITFSLSLIVVFNLLPLTLDYQENDKAFNKFLKGQNTNNRLIVLNDIDDTSNEISDMSRVISHHAYSYKKPQDNLLVSSFINFFISSTLKEITQTQYTTLDEQIKNGIINLDVRVSKNDYGQLVIDHGMVYGTISQFITELEECEIGGKQITIYYRGSGYSPNSFTSLEVENEFNKAITVNNINVSYVDYRKWAIKNTDDYNELIGMVSDNQKPTVLLALYRDSNGIIVRSLGILFASFFGFLAIGWLIFIVIKNSYNSEDD